MTRTGVTNQSQTILLTTGSRQVKSEVQELQDNLRTCTAELKLQRPKDDVAASARVLTHV
jgi:hypothetical protein